MKFQLKTLFRYGWFFVFGVLALGVSSSLQAKDLGYDQYATLYEKEPKAPSWAKNAAKHFLVYPFELIRWPIDKGLFYTEKYHLDRKTFWLYDKLVDQGITPRVDTVDVFSSIYGVELDFVRLLHQKERFPDVTLKGWVNYGYDVYFGAGAKAGFDHIGETNFHTYGVFQYDYQPKLSFYGFGPHSSSGDQTSYRMESTKLQSITGYNFSPTLSLDFAFTFRNVHIANGRDGSIGALRDYFPYPIPGDGGDKIISQGLELNHDTRNHNEDSTSGGQQRLGLILNEGLDDSRARYLKTEVEVTQYFRLLSDRRILVLHFYGERNDESRHHDVPFYDQARLGGYGVFPRAGRTLRAFDYDRFFDKQALLFNVEYRYTIWEYRNYKVDTVLFWDEGQVFERFSEFKLSDFRESYGLGLRFSVARNVLLTLEWAHGEEGSRYYLRTRAPF